MKKLLLILFILPFIFNSCEPDEDNNQPGGNAITFEKTFGGIADNVGSSVQQTTDGGYIITGNTTLYFDTGNSNVYLIKTDQFCNVY